MITLIYKDDRGRICRKSMDSVDAAFDLAWGLLRLEPFRQFAELLQTL